MGEVYLVHWIVVISMLIVSAATWGYPLATLCRRAGKPTAVGWLAGTIGLLVAGPFWCIWWLALSRWKAAPSET